MHAPTQLTRDLVLVGAGHTNLHVVRQWRRHPVPGVQLTLISPFSRATYSGMLPGTLAGLYQPDDMQIDLYRLTAGAGIRLIIAEATGLQPDVRLITFADRVALRFDVASIGIGSVPSHAELWAHSSRVLSIKPMSTFLSRLEAAVTRQRSVEPVLKCVIVGGGAAGTEVAFCLDQWLRRRGIAHHITLLDGHAKILPGYLPQFVQRAQALLAARGIEVLVNQQVVAVSDTAGRPCAELQLNAGGTLAAGIIIWATSASPPAVLDEYRLPKTDDGFLAVRPTLQTTAEAPVFVVGDTASLLDRPVPKAGVYAVREGPILWQNLQRMLAGQKLVEYRPQRGFLSLLSTGDGQALLQYKGWTQHGKWAWKLKDYIDRKFMRMYHDYRPPQMGQTTAGSPPARSEKGPPTDGMHCGGCGSKVGPSVIYRVMRRMRVAFPEVTRLLDAPDDSMVLGADVPRPEVFSVDYFRSFLDDPYVLGRISMLHALSDLWAMGALPVGAQAIVTLPYASPSVQEELLFQMLSGAARELADCGATLWGGHTIEGPELQLGFSVSGRMNGAEPWKKAGLKAGDSLVLTKRLGTGTLLAAHQRGLCRAEWFDQMLAEMLMSNQAARDIARQFPISAATDVTGFGVAGHLLEMLLPSGCSAMFELDAIWQMLLPGFDDLARTGLASTLAPANDQLFRKRLLTWDPRQDDPEQTEVAAVIDPQTSGGLLLGVPRDVTGDLVFALRRAGYFANPIGMVVKNLQPGGVSLSFAAVLEFPPRDKRTWPRSVDELRSQVYGFARWIGPELPGQDPAAPT